MSDGKPRSRHTPQKRRRKTRPTPKPPPVRAHSSLGPVRREDIQLVRTRGTPGRGGDPGGESWRIEVSGKKVGSAFINLIDEPPIGPHASIQIYLNRTNQGRKIGRVAYRLACELSEHEIIYAHMRKSNIASRRAAQAAGFSDVTPSGYTQLVMRRP